MDAILVEVGKQGMIAAIAVYFIWQVTSDKNRMAKRLDENQNTIISLVESNTTALNNNATATNALRETLNERPCLLQSERKKAC